MKILFIEDDFDSIKPAVKLLNSEGHECVQTSFSSFIQFSEGYNVDIIVLDMMEGSTDDPSGESGKRSCSNIWDHLFRPLIVYSANPALADDFDSEIVEHSLFAKVEKGSGSPGRLLEQVNKFKAYAEGISDISSGINNVLHCTLRDAVPRMIDNGIDMEEDYMQHIVKRRVAAIMDDSSLLRESLAPWGQYVYPAIGDYLRMSDVLRVATESSSNPNHHLVVLTPTCDLVKTDTRDAKVDHVLCAQCISPNEMFEEAKISKKKGEKDRFVNILNDGYLREFVPLPGFAKVLPPMAVNLKVLTLLSYDKIAMKEGDSGDYIRVASVDSPFRERIAWAYLNTGARPGVPQIDCNCWADQFLNAEENK